MKIKEAISVAMMLLLPAVAMPQAGGTFEIKKSVIAGGGQTSSGGTFALSGTVGQPLAGSVSSGGNFSIESGFWAEGNAAPVVEVNVSGRVTTPSGQGLRNAVVTLTNQSGVTRSVTTSSFGFYSFQGVPTGQTYTIRVLSKRFRFNAAQFQITGELTNVDFQGVE